MTHLREGLEETLLRSTGVENLWTPLLDYFHDRRVSAKVVSQSNPLYLVGSSPKLVDQSLLPLDIGIADLQDLLAREHVPTLSHLAFVEVIEGPDRGEVDESIANLIRSELKLAVIAAAYIAAVLEIESQIHEIKASRNNLSRVSL